MIGFENPGILVLLTIILPVAYIGYKSSKFGKILATTKILVLALLIAAAASPFVEIDQKINEEPSVKILVDQSRSAELIKEELDLEDIKTDKKVIASGNSSNLKSGILRNLEQDQDHIVVSDLQSDEELEPVVKKARDINASINILKPGFDEASSVRIEGPETTVPGAQNRFNVKIHSSYEADIEPKVELDGEKVNLEQDTNKSYNFEKSFEDEGSHQIKAQINSKGAFPESNSFYKTITVTENPKILVIGDRGSLENELSDYYDLTYKNTVPDDLSEYYSVIAKKDFDEEKLIDFVIEGNGLIYTGDIDEEKTVLPIRKSKAGEESEGAEIMLVIQTSMDTGVCVDRSPDSNLCTDTKGDGTITDSMQIAHSLVETLPYNNKVGAVAYNSNPYLISGPKSLANNRDKLKKDISRLEPGGNTLHHRGLQAAAQEFEEDGNIILISDGRITALGENIFTKRKSFDFASNFDGDITTVGVDVRNKRFLRQLARKGGGKYLPADNSGRLNFIFKAGGAEEKAGRLVKVDENHFITKGLPRLNTRTSGYDSVEPKKGSDLLVTSEAGKPFLTSWRYGLGRVGSFSGGSSDLGVTVSADPGLVTRSVSWTVGQPERKQEKYLKAEDSRKGEKVYVEASYQVDGLTREAEDLYTAKLETDKAGFHKFDETNFGYSYNDEIESIGYKPENKFLATETGGRIFTPDERQEIKNRIQKTSKRKVKSKKPISNQLITAALLIFLAQIAYRKRKGKK